MQPDQLAIFIEAEKHNFLMKTHVQTAEAPHMRAHVHLDDTSIVPGRALGTIGNVGATGSEGCSGRQGSRAGMEAGHECHLTLTYP